MLLVINAINQQSLGEGSGTPLNWYTQRRFAFLDVSGDGHLSALDALLVINEINAGRTTWVTLDEVAGLAELEAAAEDKREAEGEAEQLWMASQVWSAQELADGPTPRKRNAGGGLVSQAVDVYFGNQGRR